MSTSKESTNNNKNQNEIKKSPEKNKISNSTSDDEDSTHQSPNQPREKIRDFVIIKEVGQGSFGSVFLVEKETNKKKICNKSNKQRFFISHRKNRRSPDRTFNFIKM